MALGVIVGLKMMIWFGNKFYKSYIYLLRKVLEIERLIARSENISGFGEIYEISNEDLNILFIVGSSFARIFLKIYLFKLYS